ncbi:unnamed protein product [Owenia fusiformis]|uniref:WD repeat and HMG-box DNA-binding protein 1 n=1 Tax=Owenia fusiformis TaxID=6347 RepID=A0A8J1UJ61_OWEFU|nr:unnamed protein product [Owenia fusiformis]CAH1793165.1 unnamed protein product [Owenia fusiformis]
MPKQIDTSRYAHNEGHTDICFDEIGSKVLTCGADGDVRIWENIDDDDAVSHRVGEKAYCITCKDGKYYTAVDSNTITAHTVADGSPDGIVTRFTAPANHMVLSEDGTQMLAGASDFHIKLVKIGTSQQKTFTGHEAPILSVALDPKGEYAASSSCDGTVKIWQISDTTCVKTFSLLPKCNDVSLSKTLCRLCWSPKTGKYLVVPGDKEVLVYERDTWEMAFKIVDKSILQLVNVVEFSPNGQYLAVACVDGSLSIWDFAFRDCLNRMQHENKHTICSLAWNPRSTNQIMFCDNHGQMGVVENAIESEEKTNDEAVASNDYDSLFAADDDDLLLSATAPISKKNIIDSEDDDSESVDLAKLKKKHSAAFGIMDEDSRDTDAQSGLNIKETEAPVYRPAVPEGPKLTPLQRPFQSGSSPLHLSERYMVWNNTGIVRQYNTEDENSIDIEFHDTATHHAMHMGNTAGHTMADMSAEAVILACEADPEEKTNSKLVCMHFGTWDNAKEWTVLMPDKENIQAITIGDNWVAVATSLRNIRLFTLGGVQREIFTIPGAVVTMAAHSNQLVVAYHTGQGAPGDQCLSYIHLHISGTRTVKDGRLPLSPKATLTWLGFSHEGTPFAADSSGVIRILNRKFGDTWTQVVNTKSHAKGKSDSFWITGITESPQQLRCILCKGTTYPPTLPRPTVMLLPFKLPVCEVQSERGQAEENYWRSQVFSGHFDYWVSQNLYFEEPERDQAKMAEKEALMKLFALSCKADREFRALEICELMPDQKTLQLAIKYAAKSRHLQLAQRIGEVAQRKQEEEEAAAQSMMGNIEEDTQDFRSVINASNSQQGTQNTWSSNTAPSTADDVIVDDNETMEEEEMDEEDADNAKQSTFVTLKNKKVEPPSNATPSHGFDSQTRKNPFKIGTPKSASQPTSVRGTSVFDAMKKVSPAAKKASPIIQPKKIIKKKGAQGKIFQMKKAKNDETENKNTDSPVAEKPVSAFQLWLDANKQTLEEENPDYSGEDDLTKLATQEWRKLSKEQRQEWQEKARGPNPGTPSTPNDTDKKRKRDDENLDASPLSSKVKDTDIEQNDSKKKKPLSQSTNSKLAGFAFGKS